ncbi:hypothetical protein BTHE68_62960 (plasmid) [Burkholderia sp. THE68]|uniref:hypothetical protein n=1 Tax=Burkholderia sp. THE68 TaxID=758782 RepID=UPI001318A3C4|nr:hypothetical protein [Burkholderia sp. THE68]BBU32562.1 hypothetical protein BTHE68_62960 [Burkholderia sp. THE68]
MLVLKLALVPAFLWFISMSGKWWGPKAAGWLAGFPVVAGPILFLLAMEKGPEFAAQAAMVSVSAICASEAFNFAYAWACRTARWPTAFALALVCWLLVASALSKLPATLPWCIGVAFAAVVIGQRFLPRSTVETPGLPLRRRDLTMRMVLGALLTLVVTYLAAAVGPKWSGLLAVFPLLGSILSVSSHRAHGSEFVVSLLRGMVLGRFSFAAFCLALAVLLPIHGISIAFGIALVLSMLVQWSTRMIANTASEICSRNA